MKQTREQAHADAMAQMNERNAIFARMTGGVDLVTVRGAKHMSFSDAPYIAPVKYRDIRIDAARALEITNAYILAFFDRHLRGMRSPLLEAPSKFPEATLQIYGRSDK